MTPISTALAAVSLNLPTINPENAELPAPTSLKRFVLFSELPQEIRLIIWKATFESRAVRVSGYETVENGETPEYESLSLITPNPTTLLVNRESRFETLPFYKPLFPTLTQGSPIYFFTSLDPFVPPTRETSEFAMDSERLGNLALSDPDSADMIHSLTIENMFWSQTTRKFVQELRKPKSNDYPKIFSFHNLSELVLQTEEWYACENALMNSREGRSARSF